MIGTEATPFGAADATRFWAKVAKTDSCWLWTAAKNDKGYGKFFFRHRLWFAHRVSYTVHRGTVPHGIKVLHRCDTPLCVNPDHLFLGTQKDNLRDMAEKRRHWQQRKTHCPQGHEYTTENTRHPRRGSRQCIACHRAWRPLPC